MSKFDICRIVSGLDRKHEENQWWEARLVTPKGEVVIRRVNYYDEYYKHDLGSFIKYGASLFNPLDDYQEKLDKSIELRERARIQLVAYLLQNGWEPVPGDAVLMRREKPLE